MQKLAPGSEWIDDVTIVDAQGTIISIRQEASAVSIRNNDERCNSHVIENKNMLGAATKSAKESSELRAKLTRYEAAETWHQVTAGEGELPPAIPVLWRNNHPDFPVGELNYSIQGACGHYEWRFLSSKDVPC